MFSLVAERIDLYTFVFCKLDHYLTTRTARHTGCPCVAVDCERLKVPTPLTYHVLECNTLCANGERVTCVLDITARVNISVDPEHRRTNRKARITAIRIFRRFYGTI